MTLPTLAELRDHALRTVLPAAAFALACCFTAGAAESAPSVDTVIEKYLQAQSAGLPGKVTISLEGRGTSALPACGAPEAFLPPGAKPWGRVSVGVTP